MSSAGAPARSRPHAGRASDSGNAVSKALRILEEAARPTVRCIGAPVLDAGGHPLGAVSISTVIFLVPRDELVGHATALMATAARIGTLLR